MPMEAKEYLRQLKRLETVINQKLKELEDLKAMSTGIGGFDYSKERVQASPSQEAPFVKTISRITDLNDEINREIDEFVDKKHLIINQIHGLENTIYIQLLHKHYVEYKKLKDIAKEMNFSCDYIKHLHRHALKDFEDKILNSTPNNTFTCDII